MKAKILVWVSVDQEVEDLMDSVFLLKEALSLGSNDEIQVLDIEKIQEWNNDSAT